MTNKEQCEAYGYEWIKRHGENGYCVNPKDKTSRYIIGEHADTPEEAYATMKKALCDEYGAKTQDSIWDIFYPTNFHADYETTGKAPEYTYEVGMQMARDGKRPGFGTGAVTADNFYYMEGWIEQKDGKYIAYGEAQPNDS